jgi:predicted nuclease of restriction endonuclease-like (RecB) superfamily
MTKLSKRLPDDYAVLLAEVKERVLSAQYEAIKVVNKELVALYWDIGKLIVERQDREGLGKSVVERLANDLQNKFPGIGGFSTSNLWRMKGFCEAYADSQKLAPLVREIGWSHNIVIMERCHDPLEREFYLAYCDLPKVQPLVAQIDWSHNLNIFQRCKDHLERELELLNAEAAMLVATIKKKIDEVGV